MEFSLSRLTENGLAQVVLRDPSGQTQVVILPEYGAMLHAFIIQTGNSPHNIIDNYTTKEQLEKELSTSFKSSKLSPFACRIPEGKYMYDGQAFELQRKFMDGTAIHGLLYNKVFKETASFFDEQKASVTFRYHYKEEDDGYPFSYVCEIRYTLMPQNVLQVQTTIISQDDLPIPMTDGWHPYFALGGKINDWLLQFDSSAMVEFNDKLIPTGRLLPFDDFHEAIPIGDLRLDNCFMVNINDSYPACTLRNDVAGLQLNLYPDATYPYLQIYTPPHRESIAIENLSAAPNAFNNHMGLLMLAPRHTHTYTVHYQVSCQ